MEYRKLGRSGVLVSPLCLGTMNFGGSTSEEESFAIMQKAVDSGINFFDTANVYNKGESERITGSFLKENNLREKVVLATKVYGRMGDLPNESGSTRYHIIKACEDIPETFWNTQLKYAWSLNPTWRAIPPMVSVLSKSKCFD